MGFRVNTAGRVDQGHFSRVPNRINAPRSMFDRSFSHKTTAEAGLIYPVLWEPLLPGDTINLTMNVLARLATPIFPYMDNVYMDVHYFFVPNRLVWDHWEQLQGAQNDPDDSVEYEVPSLSAVTHSAGFAEQSIYDYFGLPTKVAAVPQDDMPIALPLRAYNLIWNQWYRDENLQDSVPVIKTDGFDTTAYSLLRRNRRKDYFTSATPWPQKGPAVQLPLGSTAPVVRTDLAPGWLATAGGTNGPLANWGLATNPSSQLYADGNPSSTRMALDPNGGLETDLSDATSATVNEWREAIVLQQMLELDARTGTRYVEALLARFGVVSPDFRLQRPEYLGGQTLDINVSPIAQNSATTTESPQGNLAGFAVARGKAGCNYSVVEHGQLLGLISFRADTTYQQGLNRHWSVRTRYDYYEPMAANLGEQAILNKELILGSTATGGNNGAFGYQERWAEYRYKNSYVTSIFRSNATATLDSWHLAVTLDLDTTLTDLVPENPPIDRIIAVSSEPQFIVDMFTRFRHARVMPIYSTPGLTRL